MNPFTAAQMVEISEAARVRCGLVIHAGSFRAVEPPGLLFNFNGGAAAFTARPAEGGFLLAYFHSAGEEVFHAWKT